MIGPKIDSGRAMKMTPVRLNTEWRHWRLRGKRRRGVLTACNGLSESDRLFQEERAREGSAKRREEREDGRVGEGEVLEAVVYPEETEKSLRAWTL